MGYFFFFDEWAMDPKIQCIPEQFRARLVQLFCLRNIQPTEHCTDFEICTVLRIPMSEVKKTKELFRKQGFIDGDGWNVKNWEKRQRGQSESLLRVRAHRARKAQNGVTNNVTRNVTSRAPGNEFRNEVMKEGEETPPPDFAPLHEEYGHAVKLALDLSDGDCLWADWVHRQAIIGHPAAWIEQALVTCPQGKFDQNWLAVRLQAWREQGGPPSKPGAGKMNGPPKLNAAQQAKHDAEIRKIDQDKRDRQIREAKERGIT